MFKKFEYKILYKRIFFTCLILVIYIIGSNISIVSNENLRTHKDSFFKLAITNVGGDLHTLNIFSLGLGPWLSSMIILTLINHKSNDKVKTQTRRERHFKERALTLIISAAQGFYIIHSYINKHAIKDSNMLILLLVLITGTLLMVWLADQNTTYGISGPMPIVLMSLVKSIFNTPFPKLNSSASLITMIIVLLVLALFILFFIELTEYRIEYNDIMNISAKDIPSYLSWKLNPAGSISIMVSLSLFMLTNNIVNFIGRFIVNHNFETHVFNFTNPVGITIYLLLQMILGYFLSRLLINTKRKSKEFLKNGNYFEGIQPGQQTEKFLGSKARRICWFGSIVVAIVLAIPMYSALLVPHLLKEVYFTTQMIVFVYIRINIAETIRAYLYFDSYKQILNKYW